MIPESELEKFERRTKPITVEFEGKSIQLQYDSFANVDHIGQAAKNKNLSQQVIISQENSRFVWLLRGDLASLLHQGDIIDVYVKEKEKGYYTILVDENDENEPIKVEKMNIIPWKKTNPQASL